MNISVNLSFDVFVGKVLAYDTRCDGRGLRDLRSLHFEVGTVPVVHGSSLFSRGETQSLATATVGGIEDAQRLDSLVGPQSKNLMVHYGFPPFSVNETGKVPDLSSICDEDTASAICC